MHAIVGLGEGTPGRVEMGLNPSDSKELTAR